MNYLLTLKTSFNSRMHWSTIRAMFVFLAFPHFFHRWIRSTKRRCWPSSSIRGIWIRETSGKDGCLSCGSAQRYAVLNGTRVGWVRRGQGEGGAQMKIFFIKEMSTSIAWFFHLCIIISNISIMKKHMLITNSNTNKTTYCKLLKQGGSK